MKKNILDSCIAKKMQCKDGAKLLHLHPKSFSRIKKYYLEVGQTALTPKPPGPKSGFIANNRTPVFQENIICQLAKDNIYAGPMELSDILFDRYGIKLNQSTVFRILRRNRVRYCLEAIRPPRRKPQLYCIETPGEELQGGYRPDTSGKYPVDAKLIVRLGNGILLQVSGNNARGQAWLIKDGKRYYIDPRTAYNAMRYLSLGITNVNLRKIQVGGMVE